MRAVNNNVIKVQIINPRNEGLPGLLAGSGGAHGDLLRTGEAIKNVRLRGGFKLPMGFEEISLNYL